MTSLKQHYSAEDIECRILTALRAAGLNPDAGLAPAELGALDHFHTGGLGASLELQQRAQIRRQDHVLDIGAGLAGPARMLAASLGCRVDCIELSSDYCNGAMLLNRLTGLTDLVVVHNGSALEMPFPDATFDVVWMQNVGMNIGNKRGLYSEIHRVLKPGGRFAFQEMTAGQPATSGVCYYPLPWASEPADSYLVSMREMSLLLSECGLLELLLEDTSESHLHSASSHTGPEQLTLAVFVDNLALKARNARRSLEEGLIRLVRGVYRKS